VPGEVARQLGGGCGGRGGQQVGVGVRAGDGEVERLHPGVRPAPPGAGGQRGEGARAVPGQQDAGLPQRVVGRRDGGAAQAEHGGQLALGGDARAERHPAVEHERAHRGGQLLVLRAPRCAGPPVAQLPGQGRTAQPHRHEATLSQVDLFDKATVR
jgi:hypothetical protein